MSEDLEACYVRSILHYDPLSGVFRWRTAKGKRVRAGSVAGCRNGGYVRIRIDGSNFRAHRLAWVWMTGEWPADLIDHKNLDGHDNRWINLRAANSSQNQANRLPTGASGIKGVRLHRDGYWEARVRVNGRQRRIGAYGSASEAAQAYETAAISAFGEFART
jgi:hypothetical protein